MAILIKTAAEIDKMRRSGEALRQVHEAVAPLVVAGASTMDLENAAAAKMDELHAISAFKGYHGFPAVLCTSINSEVVHGIPRPSASWPMATFFHRLRRHRRRLLLGCGGDLCRRDARADDEEAAGRHQGSLEKAIQQAQVGGRLGDISAAVQEMCEAEGFGVVREFVGHGIGRSMHEDPQVPNFGARGQGAAAEGRDGAGDRADDQRRRARK